MTQPPAFSSMERPSGHAQQELQDRHDLVPEQTTDVETGSAAVVPRREARHPRGTTRNAPRLGSTRRVLAVAQCHAGRVGSRCRSGRRPARQRAEHDCGQGDRQDQTSDRHPERVDVAVERTRRVCRTQGRSAERLQGCRSSMAADRVGRRDRGGRIE